MVKYISKLINGEELYYLKDTEARANLIDKSEKGAASGVATLDSSGKVPSSQLPSYVDDVIEGYYHNNEFYTTHIPGEEGQEDTYSGEITPELGKIYVDIPTNQSYRWSGSTYIVISSPYVLPTASANTLGGVKIGDGLSIDSSGVLSAEGQEVEIGNTAPTGTPKLFVDEDADPAVSIDVYTRAQIDALTRTTRKTDFDLAVLKQAVADGNLEKYGLKVGDEKTINGHTYVIAGLNPMKGSHEYRVNTNHVGLIVIPHTTQAWNASGDTSNGAEGRGAGYMNSDLHYYLKNTVLPMCNTDLGAANLISHYKLLSNNVNTSGYNKLGEASGCASDWAWENTKICALSEIQVYGAAICSSSLFDTGEACSQLDVFQRHIPAEIFGDENIWLRDVVSATYAAHANSSGPANRTSASYIHSVAGLILFH